MTDVRYEDQIRNMVAHVLSKFSRIDVLVNNSGITGPTINLADIDLKDWNDVMATNLTGPMLCAREVIKPMMAARKGSIINISSEGGRSGYPMRGPYCSIQAGSHCADRDTGYRGWGI